MRPPAPRRASCSALSPPERLQDDLDRHVYRQEQQASDGLSRGELDSRHGADQVVKKCLIPGYVIADELKGNVIDLEGDDLVAVELGHTDTDHTTCLNVPSIGLVVAGDAVYNDVHLYLAESNAKSRQSGYLHSTKLSRLIHSQLSPPISDLVTTTILDNQKTVSTSATSTG